MNRIKLKGGVSTQALFSDHLWSQGLRLTIVFVIGSVLWKLDQFQKPFQPKIRLKGFQLEKIELEKNVDHIRESTTFFCVDQFNDMLLHLSIQLLNTLLVKHCRAYKK